MALSHWGGVGVNAEYLLIINGVCVSADECSYWLPLYGSMCCRLAAQPRCMTQQMMSGRLKVKASWLSAWLTCNVEMTCLPSKHTAQDKLYLILTLIFFSTLQQLGGDPQRWTDVYAVLKGASLSCYRRQEDVEAGIEPAFTIAVNKVCMARNVLYHVLS